MTDQYELDVRRAFETFLATVLQAAERATIEGLHSAFQRAMGAAGNEHPPKADAHRRAPAPIDRVAMRDRIVACIRDNPGCNTTLLSRSLGTHRSKLRGQLRTLAEAGAIRIEERALGFGRQLRRTYFVVEPANGARTHTGVSAEPERLITSVEAMS